MRINNIFHLNFLLIFLVILLSLVGVSALYSAADGSFYPWAIRHFIRFCILFIVMILISLINIKIIFRYAYLFFFACLILLFSVEIIGTFGKGAERWIQIFGISIQPSEIIKVAIILALAKYYHNIKFDNIAYLRHLLFPIFIILLPFFLVAIQPDLGTSLCIFLLGFLIMFTAGVRIWKFVLGIIVSLASIPFLWNYFKPYQQKRLLSFLNPESDPLGQGYQLIQSK